MTPRGRRILLATTLLCAVAAAALLIHLLVLGRKLSAEVVGQPWRNPTEIYAADGMHALDVYGASWRTTPPALLEELPAHVPAAFLAAEDVRFRRHAGVDPIGVARAAFANLRQGEVAQGGSTITQQLVKMKVLTSERTFARKIPEALLAVGLELRLPKDEILEAYLNDIYLGHIDGHGVQGIGEAARLYFDKRPEQLSAGEAALLAAMVRAPNRDNPEKRPEIVRTRRDAILRVMRDNRWIDGGQYELGVAETMKLDAGLLPPTPYQFYLAALRSEVIEHMGHTRVARGGLKVHSGLDPLLQISAEKAARTGTRYLGRRYSWLQRSDQPLQAAILSLDPRTGRIRALVGGADYRESKLDRTRLMRRQPGSTFKPFVYLAAIQSRDFTAATRLRDEPITVKLAKNDAWRPQNYDERFRGDVTLREAFEKSLNIPAVRVAQKLGSRPLHRLANDVGIEGELSSTPALALGVSEMSIRELAAAYTVFPNLGLRRELHMVERIENRKGRKLYQHKQEDKRVADAAATYVIHSLLRGTVARGTASRLNQAGLGHAAGKTGTTSDYRDAWFVGYTPELLTTVWVGFDEAEALRLSSAESALPLWAAVMRLRPGSREEMAPPAGVAVVPIEPGSGLRWQEGCGRSFPEFFVDGTQPKESCRGRDSSFVLAEFEEPPVISIGQLERWLRSDPRSSQRSSRRIFRDEHEKDEKQFRRLSRRERERIQRSRRARDFEDDDEKYEVSLEKRAEELRKEMREWKRRAEEKSSKHRSRRDHEDEEDEDDEDDD